MKRLRPHSLLANHNGIRLTFRMVPMIDVVFLLLIFFVLTANFRASEGYLPADLPSQQSESNTPAELEPMSVWLSPGKNAGCNVQISGGGQLEISNDNELEWVKLRLQVEQIMQRQGRHLDDPVRLAPDAYTRWDHVVRAYDTLWRMNLTNIVFAMAE